MIKHLIIFFLVPLLGLSQSSGYEEVKDLITQKRFAKAEQLIADVVSKNPNDVKAIELLGDAFGYQKKWDDAIIQYRQLIFFDSENANYHYKYGGALGMKALSVSKFKALGLIGDVKSAFLTAAKLDSKHINARWALVELYMTLPGIVGGSKKRSLKYADELEQLSEVDGHLAKGYIYEYDKKPELAEYHYKKAVTIGGSVTCYEKLYNLYENHGQPEKAISTIEESQKRHKRNALHYQLGKVSADYNVQLAKGERCLLTYINNHTAADGVPKEWAYYRLAQIYKHKKNKDIALKYIDKALNMRSDFKQAIKEKNIILSL